MRKFLSALVAALIISAPLAAVAQGVPSYGADQEEAYDGDAQIHGRILSFDGAYSVQVRDERGYVDNVQLHQGTIINPTGLTLAPGMVVSILGYNAGPYFAANEIDTPYTFDAGYPYYAGHPWNYYGPSVSLGFFFGNPGWWHGSAFVGRPRFFGGVRVYDRVRVNTVYRGGAFQGRSYVAPRERGGYELRTPQRGDYRGGHFEHNDRDRDRGERGRRH
jgi:hypothetical protein